MIVIMQLIEVKLSMVGENQRAKDDVLGVDRRRDMFIIYAAVA